MKEGNATTMNLAILVAEFSSITHSIFLGSNATFGVKNMHSLNRSPEGFQRLSEIHCFAVKVATLPIYCKAAKEVEMDDLGSVICFLDTIILVIEQNSREITTFECQHMTKLCIHICKYQLKCWTHGSRDLRNLSDKDFNKFTSESNPAFEAAYLQVRTFTKVY